VVMIQDKRNIQIKSSPEIVFDLIETMPNKFPIYKILETKPFVFLRLLLVDGLRSAIGAMHINKPDDILILNVGDSIGSFTLTESEKPFKYWFTVRSFFVNCRTGYTLTSINSETILNFDLIFEDPSFLEKLYCFFTIPFHVIFANKVLGVIKERVEGQGHNSFHQLSITTKSR
jgi:hypothetical protein